jgi:hypothetical protein
MMIACHQPVKGLADDLKAVNGEEGSFSVSTASGSRNIGCHSFLINIDTRRPVPLILHRDLSATALRTNRDVQKCSP